MDSYYQNLCGHFTWRLHIPYTMKIKFLRTRAGIVDGGMPTAINWHSPAVHQDGYIRDPGFPDVVQHVNQGCGVLWDCQIRPASEEVVVQGVGLWWITFLHTVILTRLDVTSWLTCVSRLRAKQTLTIIWLRCLSQAFEYVGMQYHALSPVPPPTHVHHSPHGTWGSWFLFQTCHCWTCHREILRSSLHFCATGYWEAFNPYFSLLSTCVEMHTYKYIRTYTP